MAIVEAVACGLTVVRHIIYLNKSGAFLNISYSNSQKNFKRGFLFTNMQCRIHKNQKSTQSHRCHFSILSMRQFGNFDFWSC